MLRSIKEIEDHTVTAVDGDIGEVRDFYFDDALWTIRYLVVDTAGYIGAAREVLISPISFREIDWISRRFRLGLTRDKVQRGPSVELHKPVSRQFEREFHRYYDWPVYWGLGGVWGAGAYPGTLAAEQFSEQDEPGKGDPHLRSVREVSGYHIKGMDADIGHVEDFIVDERSWTIRYLVVDTSNWWFGKSVLVSPRWIGQISWPERSVHVSLPREIIKKSPEWKRGEPIDRAYETRLYTHYGWPVYWLDEAASSSDAHGEPTERSPRPHSI
ncbi:MAG: PRC-barrel domain-containing protein [Polyangiaceae bacterium]